MLQEKIMLVNNDIDAIWKVVMRQMIPEEIDTMDQDQFEALKLFNSMMTHVQEYMEEEAKAIDLINEKLRLLTSSKLKES